MAIEAEAQIPVEWVDAEEWEAIEQALAAVEATGREEQPTRSVTPREEETQSVLEDGAVATETCGEVSPGEAAGYTVLWKHESDAKQPRRLLPAWGQKKVIDEIAQVQAPQLGMKIELESTEVMKPVVVQTNLSQLTDPWAMARPACKVKVHSRSQYLQFKGRLVYSKTCSEVNAAVHDVWEMVNARRAISPGDVAVGFDLEWKTSFQRGGAPGKVAVVQLCLESSRCDVMQIVHSGIPPSLATLLEDPSIFKTGVGSRGDASKLQSDYGIQTRGVVDLSEMANQKLGRRWQSWSLSSLAEELTCKKVEKVSSVRCGDWEACPLSSPQLQYAATDAFASLYLYQILETFSTHDLKNEESSSDSPLVQQGFT